MTALSHRFDFVFLFDVTNGNPNGYRTPAICRVSIQKPIRASSPTCA